MHIDIDTNHVVYCWRTVSFLYFAGSAYPYGGYMSVGLCVERADTNNWYTGIDKDVTSTFSIWYMDWNDFKCGLNCFVLYKLTG